MRRTRAAGEGPRWTLPFLAGIVTAGAGMVLLNALGSRRRLVDPRLIRRAGHADGDVPPAVIIPGIMGSGLARPDETRVWLNLRNAVGQYNLSLPFVLPLSESRDELRPGSLLGTEHRLPRMFGFTEYYDLLELLEAAGFEPAKKTGGKGTVHHVFAFDGGATGAGGPGRDPEALAMPAVTARWCVQHRRPQHGRPHARYYLRYGTAEPAPGMPSPAAPAASTAWCCGRA